MLRFSDARYWRMTGSGRRNHGLLAALADRASSPRQGVHLGEEQVFPRVRARLDR